MRQMREQQDRNRAAECRRNREIASLKKDQRRAEVTGKKNIGYKSVICFILFVLNLNLTTIVLNTLVFSDQFSWDQILFFNSLVPAKTDGSPEKTTRTDASQEE